MAGVAALLGADVIRAQPAGAGAQGEPLEGSWRSDVAREGLPPATAFTTYSSGGGLVSTSTDPLLGPAHGAWARVGAREYAVSFVRPRLDAEGGYVGTRNLQTRIRVDETLNTQTSTGVVTDLDHDGNVVGTIQVSTRGTRIQVEPMM